MWYRVNNNCYSVLIASLIFYENFGVQNVNHFAFYDQIRDGTIDQMRHSHVNFKEKITSVPKGMSVTDNLISSKQSKYKRHICDF